MEEKTVKKSNRGGWRPGSGRPESDRKHGLCVRISDEAMEKLAKVKNKSEFIDMLIKEKLP